MNTKRAVVALLLATYPKAWRAEYGAELEDLLLARKLTVRIVANVLVSGVWQRLRRADPAVLCGLAMLVLVSVGLLANIADWPLFVFDWTTVLEPSAKTLPTIVMRPGPFGSELYVLVLAGCGWWVVAHRGGTVRQAGAAAAKISLLAGVPVMVAGLLVWLGALDLVVLAPGVPSAPSEGALTYTYYDDSLRVPPPFAVVAAPLFALPLSWLWGVVGGKLARWVRVGS